jgi:hypothetical protein
MTIKPDNHAEEQAAAQYSSIVRMLAAIECDYDRLTELRASAEALEDLTDEEREELAELEDAAGECRDEDDARQVIQEDPLEVQVRSDWTNPGETLEAGEFMILLCTGGPAVRIVGELNRGEPCRAWLEYQDWGTPWTQWFGDSSDTLCEYAANFF